MRKSLIGQRRGIHNSDYGGTILNKYHDVMEMVMEPGSAYPESFWNEMYGGSGPVLLKGWADE